jgi:Peptidyl-tRNA hydrolase PTH2
MAASPSIVQYVAMRVDLMKTLKWPTGAVIAQACHACTAVMHGFYSDACTQAYLLDVDRMHKVVVEVRSGEVDNFITDDRNVAYF